MTSIDIFYLLGVIVIIANIITMIRPNNIKEEDVYDLVINTKNTIKQRKLEVIMFVFEHIWLIVGLFTAQKMFFMMMLILNIAIPIISYFSKGFDFVKKQQNFQLILQIFIILCMWYFHFKPILTNS